MQNKADSTDEAARERLRYGLAVKGEYESGRSIRSIAVEKRKSATYTRTSLLQAGAVMRPSRNPAGRGTANS